MLKVIYKINAHSVIEIAMIDFLSRVISWADQFGIMIVLEVFRQRIYNIIIQHMWYIYQSCAWIYNSIFGITIFLGIPKNCITECKTMSVYSPVICGIELSMCNFHGDYARLTSNYLGLVIATEDCIRVAVMLVEFIEFPLKSMLKIGIAKADNTVINHAWSFQFLDEGMSILIYRTYAQYAITGIHSIWFSYGHKPKVFDTEIISHDWRCDIRLY